MESIEMIKVRSFSDLEKQKALEIFLTISIKDQKNLLKISLLQDQNMDTDFIVCLYWQETGGKKQSDISDKLIAVLKNYGWISHSVWEPMSGMAILNKETK
jgi:hypothetical protein